jgi:SOS response regulatory protein OraA/RecX
MTLTMKKIFIIAFIALGLATNSTGQTIYSSGKNTIEFKHSNGLTTFNIEMRGKIEVTDDDRDIKSISPDGYLEINKVTFGSKRTIIITPEGSGLKRIYYEGREKTPYEPEGRKWLSEILPELVRTTTLAAEYRVARFYRKGGVTEVISEIRSIESDHIKAFYGNALMELNLGINDYPKVIQGMSSSLNSDHYLTEFLEKNMGKFLMNRNSIDAVFEATSNMDSDHYKTQVLKEALERQNPSAEAIPSIIKTIGEMDSDHYKTEVINSLLKKNNLTDALIAEMIAVTLNIESDHYRSIVLKNALTKQNLSSTTFKKIVESVKEIESDHYKTEVLTDLLENKLSTEANEAVISVTESIESDHYKTNVLKSILKEQSLGEDSFKKLIEIGSQLDNDHYASQFLQTALQQPGISNDNISVVLQATSNFDSDHYITEVLTSAASRVRTGDANLKNAYRAAAKNIESETYYGRAMRAIENY